MIAADLFLTLAEGAVILGWVGHVWALFSFHNDDDDDDDDLQ